MNVNKGITREEATIASIKVIDAERIAKPSPEVPKEKQIKAKKRNWRL